MKKQGYEVKLIDRWEPPEGDDLRPLVAMPNIPKPLHLVNPRNLLGRKTWDMMRKGAYHMANDTCEICGHKPENMHQRHGHEVYEIDYKEGTATFKRVFCICSLCHLGGIHTGRAITLFKKGNPLYPKEFLLEGAEHAFKIIYEYNQDHPDADLRAYSTYLEYLKQPELKDKMVELIDKYQIKFYEENTKNMADWGDWKLIIGNKEYKTPYKTYAEWEEAMEKQQGNDTARILQKNIEEKFSGGVYDELDKIISGVTLSDVVNGTDKGDEAVRLAMKKAQEDMQKNY